MEFPSGSSSLMNWPTQAGTDSGTASLEVKLPLMMLTENGTSPLSHAPAQRRCCPKSHGYRIVRLFRRTPLRQNGDHSTQLIAIMRNSIMARVRKCEPLQVGASECPWRYFKLVRSSPGAVPKLLTNRELGCLQLDALASLLRQRGTRGGTTFAATTSCLRETLAAGALPLVS